ncbi:MAG TPA: signal peptidase II [Polyangiaceae bacterium]|jgi:signal peptidase II|nr:signal peptidase II [Polyangiaceae bacterium]
MSWAKTAAAALSVMLLVSCDHGTKHLAKTHLEGQGALEMLPGIFELRYAENTDTAFSLLHRHVDPEPRLWLLSALMVAGLLAIGAFVFTRWQVLSGLQRVGGLFVLGGALGNVIDRLARGYVIDFLHVRHWPVFNVADIAICIGGLLLLLGVPRQRVSA